MYVQKRNKRQITTTIKPEHEEYIRSQKMSVALFIEKSVELLGSYGFALEDIRDMARRLKFFGSKTVELQADVKELMKQRTRLQMQVDILKRNLAEMDLKIRKNDQK